MNKSFLTEGTATEHTIYRIVFVTPIIGIAAAFHWKFHSVAIGWLLLYGVLEAVNILFHQMAVKRMQSIQVEILSKSKTLTTYLLSLILMIESVSVKGMVGILIFMTGIYLTIDFHKMKVFFSGMKQGKSEKDFYGDLFGFGFELLSVLSRTVKPFILYRLVVSGSISNEVLAFLSMPIALFILIIVFLPTKWRKKDHSISEEEIVKISGIPRDRVIKYMIQGVIVGASMITSGYAIIFSGAVMTAMTENFSILAVGAITFFLYHEKMEKRMWFASLLAILGMILI